MVGGVQLHGGGLCHLAAPPMCALSALETHRVSFCCIKDDDSFLAAVSRGWSKHFPKIAGKRERGTQGEGLEQKAEGKGADRSWAAERKRTKWGSGMISLGSSGGVSTVTCPRMFLALPGPLEEAIVIVTDTKEREKRLAGSKPLGYYDTDIPTHVTNRGATVLAQLQGLDLAGAVGERTDTQTKLGLAELGFLMGKPQLQGSSVCLFYTGEQEVRSLHIAELRG